MERLTEAIQRSPTFGQKGQLRFIRIEHVSRDVDFDLLVRMEERFRRHTALEASGSRPTLKTIVPRGREILIEPRARYPLGRQLYRWLASFGCSLLISHR